MYATASLLAPDARPVVRPGGGAYRRLLGEDNWQRLPLAVQRRFARELAPGESAVYLGEVVIAELTTVGWLWAQLARCVGAPLPLKEMTRAASSVVVTADAVTGSQCWTRTYQQTGQLPQAIRSIKSFSGPTGLEERVGGGIGMALEVFVESHALVFRSAGYYWQCGSALLRIPGWLTPGRMEVRHREERDGSFSFTLSVMHPWFGQIIHQLATFRDIE